MKVASPASRGAPRRVDNSLPEIEQLRITDRRQSRVAVHERLRQLILGGSLPPGTVLAQVPLARALGVSRTPLREALRMLQEEGLVHGEPNHRTRVTGFDSTDLEFVYSTRILLESFAVAMTAGSLTAAGIQSAERALRRMRTAIAEEDFAGWRRAHRDFHRVLVQGAGDQLVQLIEVQADRAERYLRFYQLRDTRRWWSRDTESEHRELLETATHDDPDARSSVTACVHHLARTALWVIAEADPERDPHPIRLAMKMALRGPEAQSGLTRVK
jgi:DNA-binding GntR family transcriptional regulator